MDWVVGNVGGGSVTREEGERWGEKGHGLCTFVFHFYYCLLWSPCSQSAQIISPVWCDPSDL